MGQPWNSVVCLPVFSTLMWMYCCCLHSCLNPLYNLSSLLCKWINKTFILCFICRKMANLFTWGNNKHTEDGRVCSDLEVKVDVSQPVPSFRIQCYQKLWGEKTQRHSMLQQRGGTVPCNWTITYLDLIVSPGMWNGLHITSVKELCNFLNI